MQQLKGLKEYLRSSYDRSVFQAASESTVTWSLHLCHQRVIEVKIDQDLEYDLQLEKSDGKLEIIPKLSVKLVYPGRFASDVPKLLKTDSGVNAKGLEPHLSPAQRFHIKNKSLFPLMKERQVVFFTLLEGEIVRGLISDFSRYEITVKLKSGIPVVLLRHAVYDLRDKSGRCYLKRVQESARDWRKSPLFVSNR